MAASPSFFHQLLYVVQSDPLESIELTLDVAPGPRDEAIPLLERSDGPPCGRPNCSRHSLYARGYSNQSALEFSLRVRFAKEITGYTPSRVRRATTTLVAPADKVRFYRSDEIRWTDVLQRSSTNDRIHAELDANGYEIAVFEIPHEPEAVGLVIRHTLLEALEQLPELNIIVVSSAPTVPSLAVPALWQEPSLSKRPQRRGASLLESGFMKAILKFLSAVLMLILGSLIHQIHF